MSGEVVRWGDNKDCQHTYWKVIENLPDYVTVSKCMACTFTYKGPCGHEKTANGICCLCGKNFFSEPNPIMPTALDV